jgi:hypothetical protein
MIDVEQTIISQYGNSPTLLQLIYNMNGYIDPRADFDTFFDYVWNVNTAQGFGLDYWGRIVGVNRELEIIDDVENFGFIEASMQPFGQAPFYNGVLATHTYTLADDAYRRLIFAQALANISTTTAPAINQLLKNFFAGRGRAYVNDLGNMTMRYVFEFDLTHYEFAIVTQSGILPRPAGVTATIYSAGGPVFGFKEAGMEPFGQAPFSQPEV